MGARGVNEGPIAYNPTEREPVPLCVRCWAAAPRGARVHTPFPPLLFTGLSVSRSSGFISAWRTTGKRAQHDTDALRQLSEQVVGPHPLRARHGPAVDELDANGF